MHLLPSTTYKLGIERVQAFTR